MEIADRVHHFTNYKFNWYLIEDQGRLTVLDTGFPGHYRLFERSVQTIGRCINDVEAIIITHAHADHTGMAPRIHRESGAPIYLHEADVPHARRPLYLPWAGLLTNAWRPYTASMLVHGIFNGLLRLPTIWVTGKRWTLRGNPTSSIYRDTPTERSSCTCPTAAFFSAVTLW